MKFMNWFSKNSNKIIEPEINTNDKDYSTIGIDNTNYNYDITTAGAQIPMPNVIINNNYGVYGDNYNLYNAGNTGKNTFPLYVMHSLIKLYNWMAQDPDIGYAIDEIVNEITSISETENIVELSYKDENIENKKIIPDKLKESISKEFNNILNLMDFENTAHFHINNFYINGRTFYKIDVNKDKIDEGITAIKQIIPFDVVAYFDDTNKFANDNKLEFNKGWVITENAFKTNLSFYNTKKSNNDAQKFIAVPEELIIYQHSGLIDYRYNVPVSYLHKTLKTLNQLRSMTDAMVIYRLTRAPERFVFNVEVGSLPQTKAEEYVTKVAARLKQNVLYDSETGNISDSGNKQNIYNDWFFPKVEGQGTEVNVLQSGNMTGQLEEIDAITKKLFRQLFLPSSRLNQEGSFNFSATGEIERSEIKFFKFISKIQKQFNYIFYELLKRQLSFKNILDAEKFEEYKKYFKFKWGSENLFNENKNISLWRRKAAAISEFDNYSSKYVSIEWVRKTLLGLNDEDIKQIEKQIENEMKTTSYRNQVQTGTITFDKSGKEININAAPQLDEPGGAGTYGQNDEEPETVTSKEPEEEEALNEKNTQKIKLLQNLNPLEMKLTMLRKAKNIDDIEIVNMTQLGRMNDQKIKYEKVE